MKGSIFLKAHLFHFSSIYDIHTKFDLVLYFRSLKYDLDFTVWYILNSHIRQGFSHLLPNLLSYFNRLDVDHISFLYNILFFKYVDRFIFTKFFPEVDSLSLIYFFFFLHFFRDFFLKFSAKFLFLLLIKRFFLNFSLVIFRYIQLKKFKSILIIYRGITNFLVFKLNNK